MGELGGRGVPPEARRSVIGKPSSKVGSQPASEFTVVPRKFGASVGGNGTLLPFGESGVTSGSAEELRRRSVAAFPESSLGGPGDLPFTNQPRELDSPVQETIFGKTSGPKGKEISGAVAAVKEELITALSAREPEAGYPGLDRRLRMTDEQIDEWFEGGRDYRALQFNPSAEHPMGINWLIDHPNRVSQIERERQKGIPESQSRIRRDDGIQDFHDVTFREPLLPGWTRDSRGVPIAPWYREALQCGAVTGPGFYWDYGENASANAIMLGEHEETLYLGVIRKVADGRIFVPGGMIDPEDPDPEAAAIREASEETGFLKGFSVEDRRDALCMIHPLPVKALGTRRLTINAGEASASVVLVAKDPNIRSHPLERGDDATDALWTPLNRDVLGQLFVPHANDVRLAVQEYEKQNGVKIAPDGTMHAA